MGIFESIFDVAYLLGVVTLSLIMLNKGQQGSMVWLFGLMGLVLGLGDSFHLVPRIISHLTGDFASHAAALGYGKMVTSMTMTFFYVILYRIWELRNGKGPQKGLRAVMGSLAIIRIILSLMPQNNWAELVGSYAWGIYRNIPFTIMGILIVWLILKEAQAKKDHTFKIIGYAVIVSFACYLPVVLFASAVPAVGALMMPKTLAYFIVVLVGFQAAKNGTLKEI